MWHMLACTGLTTIRCSNAIYGITRATTRIALSWWLQQPPHNREANCDMLMHNKCIPKVQVSPLTDAPLLNWLKGVRNWAMQLQPLQCICGTPNTAIDRLHCQCPRQIFCAEYNQCQCVSNWSKFCKPGPTHDGYGSQLETNATKQENRKISRSKDRFEQKW